MNQDIKGITGTILFQRSNGQEHCNWLALLAGSYKQTIFFIIVIEMHQENVKVGEVRRSVVASVTNPIRAPFDPAIVR